jgi:hypothetical protein
MFYFTPLPGFFSPFPRGTCSLSVTGEYLALRGGPREFTRNFSCTVLLRIQLARSNFRLRGFHSLWRAFQTLHLIFSVQYRCPITPTGHASWFGLFPVRSPLLRKSLFIFSSFSY